MSEDNIGVGRPSKYTQELGEEIARNLTHSTIKKTCELVGIHESTYYEWLHDHDGFSELSTRARKTKAVNHFAACEDILEDMKLWKNDESYRPDVARVRLDFHLRLAGKANQGLFGDTAKNQVNVTVDNKDIDAPARQGEKEWTANLDKE